MKLTLNAGGAIELIFPTVIHTIDIAAFKTVQKDLIKHVYNEKKKDSKGRQISNVGGWQSGAKSFKEPNLLSKLIQLEVGKYFHANKILKDTIKLTFDNYWININRKGDFNTKHIHQHGHLSGVLYLKVPKDSGNIGFDSPHSFTHAGENDAYSDNIREACCTYPFFGFAPKAGNILMFPSSLYHAVEPSRSEEDRISASFNLHLL